MQLKDGVETMTTTQVDKRDNFDNCTLSMILQVNDRNDVESLKSLIDPVMPPGIVFLSSYYDLVNYNFQKVQAIQDVQFYARMFRLKMFPQAAQSALDLAAGSGSIGRQPQRPLRRNASGANSQKEAMMLSNEFNRVMQTAYKELAADLIKEKLTPCVVVALRT